jgi:uncharacterized protein (DUF427 family)
MVKAKWNGVVLAESDKTVMVEGNHYFPMEDVNTEYFAPTDYHTVCPWKGEASYYTLNVNGESNENAAWTYPETKQAANHIKGYVAFWRGVEVTR